MEIVDEFIFVEKTLRIRKSELFLIFENLFLW